MNEEKQYNLNMSFNTITAIKYGVNESIFLNNLIFWISVNKANNINFHDGKTWSYNSMEAFTKIFPFWSIGQIKRIIDSLKEQGVIISGNYNQSPYNRTMWYALTDESIIFVEKDSSKLSIVCNQKMDEDVSDFPNTNNSETLKDVLPYTNKNTNNTNTYIDGVNNIPKVNSCKRKYTVKEFVIPTVDDIQKFIDEAIPERNLDALQIFNTYNDNDWYDAYGNKVLNWKTKIRNNWQKRKEDNEISEYPVYPMLCGEEQRKADEAYERQKQEEAELLKQEQLKIDEENKKIDEYNKRADQIMDLFK